MLPKCPIAANSQSPLYRSTSSLSPKRNGKRDKTLYGVRACEFGVTSHTHHAERPTDSYSSDLIKVKPKIQFLTFKGALLGRISGFVYHDHLRCTSFPASHMTRLGLNPTGTDINIFHPVAMTLLNMSELPYIVTLVYLFTCLAMPVLGILSFVPP